MLIAQCKLVGRRKGRKGVHSTRGRSEGPRSPPKVAQFRGEMLKLFSSRSGGKEGGGELLLGLKLKNFAADSNFSEKNGSFVATGPGPCQILMTSPDFVV